MSIAQPIARLTCPAETESDCPICGGHDSVVDIAGAVIQAKVCDHIMGCSTCRGTGYRPGRDAKGYEVQTPCALRDLRRRVQLFNSAQLPPQFVQATLASYLPKTPSQRDAHMRVGAFLAHLDRNGVLPGGKLPRGLRGLALSGPPGTGKTHLMVSLARALTLEYGVAVHFTDFSQLLWSLKAGFQEGKGEAQLIAPLVDVEVLLIDELGKGRASEWEVGVLDALVAGRYNRGGVTFFATNYAFAEPSAPADANAASKFVRALDKSADSLDVEGIGSRVGPRIFSRLSAMCDLVRVDGADARPGSWQSPAARPTRGKA